jgi:hypothetical protein
MKDHNERDPYGDTSLHRYDPCVELAGIQQSREVLWITRQHLIAWQRQQRNQRIDDIRGLRATKQCASVTRIVEHNGPHIDHRQRTRQARLASTIAPRLTHGRRRGHQVRRRPPSELDQSRDPPIVPIDPDQRTGVEH